MAAHAELREESPNGHWKGNWLCRLDSLVEPQMRVTTYWKGVYLDAHRYTPNFEHLDFKGDDATVDVLGMCI